MTGNRELLELAGRLGDDMGRLATELAHGLLQRIGDATAVPGLVASRPAGTSHSGRGPSDPTATAALRAADLATLHRSEIERCLYQMASALRRALQIADGYPEPTMADADARALLARLNAEPGCQSCIRVPGPTGTPRWEPPDSRLHGGATTAGVLDAPMLLCRWCHDRLRQWGRLPTPAELALHHAGRKVPWPADVERPA